MVIPPDNFSFPLPGNNKANNSPLIEPVVVNFDYREPEKQSQGNIAIFVSLIENYYDYQT
jgi:hypothetical protein